MAFAVGSVLFTSHSTSRAAETVPVSIAPDTSFDTTRDLLGEIGYLDMPSARMAPDGQFAMTVGALQGARRFNFEFQALPWLEASFRYASESKYQGTNQTTYDRSFGLKIRLLDENQYRPDISLGVRDLLGTGVYSSEYLVLSKRFRDFDLSVGMGWGRLADSGALNNPIAQIFKSFETRGSNSANGGTVDFNRLFHGPKVGLFAGGAWHTPIDGVDLLLEYSSDHYTRETSFGAIKYRSPINMGLAYHPFDFITVSAGWLYGSTYGLGITLAADPTVPASLYRLGPKVPPPVVRPDMDQSASLSLYIDQRRPLADGAPFVTLGRTNDTVRAVQAALLSDTVGVRGVEIVGRTLMVDAHVTGQPESQCSAYARVAATVSPSVDSLAVSDIEQGGTVSVCQIKTANMRVPERYDSAKSEGQIRDGINGQSLGLEAIAIQGAEVWVYFHNFHYYSESEAVGRIARVLMGAAPPEVEIFHIIDVKNGLPMQEANITRSGLERMATVRGSATEMGDAISLVPAPLNNPILEAAASDSYPRFHWSFGPNVREGLFDPDSPIEVQIYAYGAAQVEFAPGLAVDLRGEANIYNDYDFNRKSDSQLPHVRSDVLEYYQHGATGITEFDASYRTRLSSETFFEAKAGILEGMFTGAGAQVLWRPQGERISFGADAYEVWQRDFNRLFGVQDYHVLTGHVTIYYASPWYGLNFAIHAGRYLAGDYGGTFEITREFSTGIEIGAFATLTNVPFAKFGEGSFDKGLFVRIPFEWGLPFYSQTTYDLTLHSLTRDGGQRLIGDDSLHNDTEAASYDEMAWHVDDITTP